MPCTPGETFPAGLRIFILKYIQLVSQVGDGYFEVSYPIRGRLRDTPATPNEDLHSTFWFVGMRYTDRWSKHTAMVVTPRQEHSTRRAGCAPTRLHHTVFVPLFASFVRTLFNYCAWVTRSKNGASGMVHTIVTRAGYPSFGHSSRPMTDDPMGKGLCVTTQGRWLAADYHPCETQPGRRNPGVLLHLSIVGMLDH